MDKNYAEVQGRAGEGRLDQGVYLRGGVGDFAVDTFSLQGICMCVQTRALWEAIMMHSRQATECGSAVPPMQWKGKTVEEKISQEGGGGGGGGGQCTHPSVAWGA